MNLEMTAVAQLSEKGAATPTAEVCIGTKRGPPCVAPTTRRCALSSQPLAHERQAMLASQGVSATRPGTAVAQLTIFALSMYGVAYLALMLKAPRFQPLETARAKVKHE